MRLRQRHLFLCVGALLFFAAAAGLNGQEYLSIPSEPFDAPGSELQFSETASETPVASEFSQPVEGPPSFGNDVTWESCPPEAAEECPPPADKPAPKKDKPNPCKKSHKPLFFDNDFSYLNDDEYDGCCLGDRLKQLSLGSCGCKDECECDPCDPCCECPDDNFCDSCLGKPVNKLDIGGQLRLRFHDERGMGQRAGARRFQQTANDFLLMRLRLYGNYQATERLRLYAEGIFADVAGATAGYAPRGIDRNRGDFLNLFFDWGVTDNTTVRIGRQELLFGAQRLVSPLDWANTRRTFEGVRVLQKFDKLKLDWFYTNFVPVDVDNFDEADYDRAFYGLYGSYKNESSTWDAYYLGFDDQRAAGDFSLHTIGSRVNGSNGNFLYEAEGGLQFGDQDGLGLNHEGAFATVGVGRKAPDRRWKPTLWLYYDYASGNNLGGDFNRFNQQFPLAHKYLGFIDAVQRANIESVNVLLTTQPTKSWKLLLWYYHFMSNQDTDIVPSIGGTPLQSNGSKDLGDELDFLASYTISPRSNLVVGYSHFWRGNKILDNRDADFAYVQWQLDF